jgi:hypothetical protein
MLNDNMRTDILRSVHQRIQARMDQRDKKSPLEILIESIEEVIGTFEDVNSFECVDRNPFNIDPHYSFNPELDYIHDIKVLKSQL